MCKRELEGLAMETLIGAAGSVCVSNVVCPSGCQLNLLHRHLQIDPRLPSFSSFQAPLRRKTVPDVRMGQHPDWRQVDNKMRRLESKLADFRILTNDLRIQKRKLESGDPSENREKLLEVVRRREAEVKVEIKALQVDMENLTLYFHLGAEREYVALRKFFLSYLYHTSRNAFENLKTREFDRLLRENPEGITYDLPDRGTVSFAPHLCKIIAAGQRIAVSGTGIDTSPLAVALAIIQAESRKHCNDPKCRREECHVLKADYEELFESFFKRKVRVLINQKVRAEMPSHFDNLLKIRRSTAVEVS